MKVVFHTDSDKKLATLHVEQPPPDDTSISIEGMNYRVAWSEWDICRIGFGYANELVVNVFLVESTKPSTAKI